MDVFDFQNYTLAPDSEFPYEDRETTCKTNLLWVLFHCCCRLSSIPFVEVRRQRNRTFFSAFGLVSNVSNKNAMLAMQANEW